MKNNLTHKCFILFLLVSLLLLAPVGALVVLAQDPIPTSASIAQSHRALVPRAGLTWHGIGHLQRNKAAMATDLFDVFHALDSKRLMTRLEGVLSGADRRWPVYIQVNAAEDPAKGGFAPEETLAFVKDVSQQPHLSCRGFMTMGRLDADEADTRAAFRTLREVRDEAVRLGIGAEAPEGLSMGMTDDFEWAVEEGATVVRVGTAVFQGVTGFHGLTGEVRS